MISFRTIYPAKDDMRFLANPVWVYIKRGKSVSLLSLQHVQLPLGHRAVHE
jgi:hypothetical protein